MRRKFNWLDVVIIAALIGIVYIGYSFMTKSKAESTAQVPIEVVYRTQGLLMESVNAINEGDTFWDSHTNQVIGELIDKEVKQSYEYVETGEGRIVKSINPNRFDLYMTIRGLGIVRDDYIRMGDIEMRIEGIIKLKRKVSSVSSTITAIEIGE